MVHWWTQVCLLLIAACMPLLSSASPSPSASSDFVDGTSRSCMRPLLHALHPSHHRALPHHTAVAPLWVVPGCGVPFLLSSHHCCAVCDTSMGSRSYDGWCDIGCDLVRFLDHLLSGVHVSGQILQKLPEVKRCTQSPFLVL